MKTFFLRFLRRKFLFDAEDYMDPQVSLVTLVKTVVFRGENDVNYQDFT